MGTCRKNPQARKFLKMGICSLYRDFLAIWLYWNIIDGVGVLWLEAGIPDIRNRGALASESSAENLEP